MDQHSPISPQELISNIIEGDSTVIHNMRLIEHSVRSNFFKNVLAYLGEQKVLEASLLKLISVLGEEQCLLRSMFCCAFGEFLIKLLRKYLYFEREKIDPNTRGKDKQKENAQQEYNAAHLGFIRIIEGVLVIAVPPLCCDNKAISNYQHSLYRFLHVVVRRIHEGKTLRIPRNTSSRLICMLYYALEEEGNDSFLCKNPPEFLVPRSFVNDWIPKLLNIEALSVVSKLTCSPEEIEDRNAYVEKLNTECFEKLFFARGVKFGSAVNGFHLNCSDVDVVMNLPEETKKTLSQEYAAQKDLHTVEAELDGDPDINVLACRKLFAALSRYHDISIEVVEKARVPLVRIHRECKGSEIDVSFNSELGPLNSALLRAYAESDIRSVLLGVIIKRWAKARGVADSYAGYLSPYAWILLVIFFLQMKKILPNLQQPPLNDIHNKKLVSFNQMQHNISFFDPPARREPSKTYQRFFPRNLLEERNDLNERQCFVEGRDEESNLGHLVAAFFLFYSTEFNFVRNVVSIRTAPRKVSKFELYKVMDGKNPQTQTRSRALSDNKREDDDIGENGQPKSSQTVSENFYERPSIRPKINPPVPKGAEHFQVDSRFHDFTKQRFASRLSVINIEDPMENGRILCPTFNGMEKICYELRRAAVLLLTGHGLESILQTCPETDRWDTEMSLVPVPLVPADKKYGNTLDNIAQEIRKKHADLHTRRASKIPTAKTLKPRFGARSISITEMLQLMPLTPPITPLEFSLKLRPRIIGSEIEECRDELEECTGGLICAARLKEVIPKDFVPKELPGQNPPGVFPAPAENISKKTSDDDDDDAAASKKKDPLNETAFPDASGDRSSISSTSMPVHHVPNRASIPSETPGRMLGSKYGRQKKVFTQWIRTDVNSLAEVPAENGATGAGTGGANAGGNAGGNGGGSDDSSTLNNQPQPDDSNAEGKPFVAYRKHNIDTPRPLGLSRFLPYKNSKLRHGGVIPMNHYHEYPALPMPPPGLTHHNLFHKRTPSNPAVQGVSGVEFIQIYKGVTSLKGKRKS